MRTAVASHRNLFEGMAAGLLGLAMGAALVAGPRFQLLLGAVGGFGILLAVLRLNRGVVVGLGLLVVLNSLPLIDLRDFSAHSEDYAVLVLGGGAVSWMILSREGAGAVRVWQPPRWLAMWAAAFVGLWLLTLLRAWVFGGVSVLPAAFFGRDFLTFALLTVLLVPVLSSKAALTGLLWTLLVGSGLRAIGGIALSITGDVSLGLVHADRTIEQLGLIRVYSDSIDLLPVGVAAGLGLAAYGSRRNLRWAAASVAILCVVGTLLQLTRARYLGLGVGGGSVVLAWAFAGRAYSERAVAGIVALALILISAGFALDVQGSAFGEGAFDSIAQRTTSPLDDLATSTGSIGLRREGLRKSAQILGSDWLWGLGFLHPGDRYFVDLPAGTIRNPDLGVLEVVMTMGVIGALGLYLPFVVILVRLVRCGRDNSSLFVTSARLVVAVWIATTLAGSLTLGTMYSLPGLVLSASLIAAGVAVIPNTRYPEKVKEQISAH